MNDWPVMSMEQLFSDLDGYKRRWGGVHFYPSDAYRFVAKAQAKHTGELADAVIALVIFLAYGKAIQDVIDYLKNEIATQDKRTAGEPKLKAHLNAVERVNFQTLINALEEWQSLRGDKGE